MFYVCDNCESMFSDNDNFVITEKGDYCCDDCAKEYEEKEK